MNSALYGKSYPLPKQIINKLETVIYNNSDVGGDGFKRAKNLVKSGSVTYQQLKRLKNFFDKFNEDENSNMEREFAGGEDMRFFVETTLERERSRETRSTDLKRPVLSLEGQKALHAQNSNVNLREWNELSDENLNKNVIAIIFNRDMKLLLLQRSSYEEQWMPNKWALVGGGVEEDEEPIDAVKREIKEEIGLEIDNFIEKFALQRTEDSIEYMFIAKYNGKDNDVKLNEEHQDYGWYFTDEIVDLDSVPNLMDYIKIALTKYE